MINLPGIGDAFLVKKRVLVRADLEWSGKDSQRERVTKEIVEYLKKNGAEEVKLIGHKGKFEPDLRADPREEADDGSLAEELAEGWDVYVNEAFATSYRKHCSIDALPRFMKSQGKEVGVGLRFEEEITHLSFPSLNLREGMQGRVIVIGGAKGDKEKYADDFEKKGWTVLRGGLLPGAKLRPDGLDISDEEISNFKFLISKAEVVVLAGPMGKYDEAPEGTREVFTAVANSKAYKIAGGGDTEAALGKFGLLGKFDWISVGGGAMLEFLATGTLVG